MTTRPLTAKLLTYPVHALATLFYVWEQSRTNDPIPLPEEIDKVLKDDSDVIYEAHELAETYKLLGAKFSDIHPRSLDTKAVRDRLRSVIDKILDEDIPCTENLNFVFAIDNMSISLREQMVRHRIGVTIGERTGIDIVPEISKSSWWSQTMRMLPMGKFASEGRYILPESLEGKTVGGESYHQEHYSDGKTGHVGVVFDDNTKVSDLYHGLMQEIEFVYNKLIEAGVPMEDARQVIPIGASHGITWSLNLKAMMHIVGKRACWVAQANLWEVLISAMVDELATKVDPVFRKMILPPCFKNGKFNACPYFQINRERVQGRDHMPPCPLYVYHEPQLSVEASERSKYETGFEPTWVPPHFEEGDSRDIRDWSCTEPVEEKMLHENIERFERLWKLNVMTGERLD